MSQEVATMSDMVGETIGAGISQANPTIRQTIDLLGGTLVSRRALLSDLEVHEVLLKGMSGKVLTYVVRHAKILDRGDLLKVAGVSFRTVQRLEATSNKLLSSEQSGRVWKFAEILAKAIDVFGTREEAERWLATPAIALDQRRPVDLLASPVGIEMVEQLLGRLKFGVYT
jgi:putative toxin-antitoxin system antitoxin component (TIGR02293 family)